MELKTKSQRGPAGLKSDFEVGNDIFSYAHEKYSIVKDQEEKLSLFEWSNHDREFVISAGEKSPNLSFS